MADRLHLLIVDDDEVDRRIVRRSLKRSAGQLTVDEAEDPQAALRLVVRNTYDCIFLDYNIPGGDGLSLLRALRQANVRSPVVVLTGQGHEELAVELMKAGATDYVVKSTVTTERLERSLRYALSLAKAEAAASAAHDELEATAERLRLAADSAAIGTWDFNPVAGSVVWDARTREIYGAGDAEAAYDTFIACVHPDDRDRVRGEIEAALDPTGTGQIVHEYRVVHPDGVTRWVHARGRVIFDESSGTRRAVRFVGTVVDATERKQREEELREEALIIETLHRIGASITADLDLPRIVQTVTDEGTQLTRAQFGTFCYNGLGAGGESYMLFTTSGVPASAAEEPPPPPNIPSFEVVFRGPGVVRSADIRRDPGHGQNAPPGIPAAHMPVVSYLAVPVRAHDGRVIGGLFFGHPEPDRFDDRAERLAVGIAAWAGVACDNALLYDAAQNARMEAERANRAKAEFLAAMSHDLRTPLNAIGGYAQLVEEGVYGPVTSDQQRALTRIQDAQRHLLSLINDILNFAKVEAGTISMNIAPVSVDETIRMLRTLIEPQMAAKKLSYEYRPGADGAMVLADREKLFQILLNLLSNAVKFTSSGGVSVHWEALDGQIAIHVEDTGPGIAAENLTRIFEPFVQVRKRTEDEREGAGLGLAISRELARAMGGDVFAASSPGTGSTFTLVLARAV